MPSVKLGVTFRPPSTALSSVTVKVIESPSLAEASSTVTAALPSSSVMVSVWLEGAETPLPPATVADTVTFLSAATASLFAAVIVTVPVLVVEPAAMVSFVLVLRVKSEAVAGETGDADTVTVTASLETALSSAVTVAEPPSSPIEDLLSTRDTVGVSSSSVIVRV